MAFTNDKKTFLEKQDKSKKGAVDEKVLPIISLINAHPRYYTTSSCSGRAYLWCGQGKKNETEWLRVSHGLIDGSFLRYAPATARDAQEKGLVWLRVEPFILHIACKDLRAANKLLALSRRIYKKSCILTASRKILVELRGSEFLETPLFAGGKALCTDFNLLAGLANEKMEKIKEGRKKFLAVLKEAL